MGLQVLPNIYVPTFDMAVNYVPLPLPIAKQVISISVTQHLDPPNSFRFRLNDPKLILADPQTGLFTEGTRVDISMGFVSNTRKLIVGEITALTADFPNSGPSTLEVEGMDLLNRLSRGTVYRRFDGPDPSSGLSDDEIVTQIASEMNLLPDVDPTGPRAEARVQSNVSNLALVKQLADLDGYYLWADGDTLHFKQQRPAPTSISLEWGKTLMSFSPRLTTAGQVQSVEVRGWDPVQKQSFSVTVQRPGGPTSGLSASGQSQLTMGSGGQSKLLVTDAKVASAQEAQDYAQAILTNQQQTMITGSGTSVGQPDMQVGTQLDLRGVGRFSGTYTVQQATHTINAGGYQTSFEVRRQS